MVLNYIKEKALVALNHTHANQRPAWVSESNASLRAWQYVESQISEKLHYIKLHNKLTHFSNKYSYQISAAEIAREINLHRSTLMHGSSYSEQFTLYLKKVNSDLENAKNQKLKAMVTRPSRGAISDSKDVLVKTNVDLRKRLAELESQKTAELVCQTLDKLPLPIRRALGIE